MTAKELNDKLMDSIVGGSSYMTDLADFIQTGHNGEPCFNFSAKSIRQKGDKIDISISTHFAGASDKGMALMLKSAERCGSITLIAANGVEKVLTAAAIKDMM